MRLLPLSTTRRRYRFGRDDAVGAAVRQQPAEVGVVLRVGVCLEHEQHLPDGTPGVGLGDLLHGGEVQGELVEGFRVDESLRIPVGFRRQCGCECHDSSLGCMDRRRLTRR